MKFSKLYSYQNFNKWFEMLYYSILGVACLGTLYDLVAFFLIRISCSYYYSFTHDFFSRVTGLSYVSGAVLFVWHCGRRITEKRWKKLIIETLIIGAIVISCYFSFHETFLYCFLYKTEFNPAVDWGPH